MRIVKYKKLLAALPLWARRCAIAAKEAAMDIGTVVKLKWTDIKRSED